MSMQAGAIERQSVVPADKSLAEWIESRTARYETRTLDWNALKFQADLDPKYRRAQMRYVGTGATGVGKDSNTVAAEHFTFSTMVLPAGCEGPLHVHDDVEEVFFILKGSKVKLMFKTDGDYHEMYLKDRDLVSVPAGVYRGLVNEGLEEALMIICLGTNVPETPTYPPDHPLASVKRPKP
jgi:mannose-6-phosphate isomerase-like protein (cupin superfamily)